MKLNQPFCISSRLLPAVKIGDAWLSIEPDGTGPNGRTRYRYYLDTAGFEHTGNDLSGISGLQEIFESLLAFLGAAAESYRYNRCEYNDDPDSNCSLFPKEVVEWAYQNDSEIGCLELELSENKELIEA